MNVIRKTIRAIHEARQARRTAKVDALSDRIKDKMAKKLQVMEYCGKLCICCDGTPIIHVTHLQGGIVEELEAARLLAFEYEFWNDNEQ